jgi:hypothetical protein
MPIMAKHSYLYKSEDMDDFSFLKAIGVSLLGIAAVLTLLGLRRRPHPRKPRPNRQFDPAKAAVYSPKEFRKNRQ